MDYVAESGTLLIGTNTHSILPHPIADLMRFENAPRHKRGMIGDMEDASNGGFDDEYYGAEESKDDEGDQTDFILDGMSVDDKIAQIVAQ